MFDRVRAAGTSGGIAAVGAGILVAGTVALAVTRRRTQRNSSAIARLDDTVTTARRSVAAAGSGSHSVPQYPKLGPIVVDRT